MDENNSDKNDGWVKDKGKTESPKPTTWLSSIPFLIICFVCGIVFGFSLEKGRVFEPNSIRLQMVFEKWIMMKMFLGAMATSLICFGILSLIPIDFVQNRFTKAQAGFESVMKTKNSLSIVCGTFVLGVGMTLSGACPGMVLPQVGAWAQQAIWTFVGALVGNLLYGLLHDKFYEKLFPPGRMVLPTTIPARTGVKFAILSLPLGAALYAGVILLEVLVPWKSDVEWQIYSNNTERTTFLNAIAWPPSICGTLIGLLQLAFVLGDAHTMGGSGSYNTLVAQFIRTKKLAEMFPYLAKKRDGPGNWWQVSYVFGGIFGGAISAILSGTWGDVPGVPIPYAFIGGMLLLIGARLAAGCTSGHGLSGSGMLFFASFLAVPFMFAGAIATGFMLKAIGQLYIL